MERTTMSVQELSAQMGISLPKAYELVKTPGFPTLRIGTRILIPIDAYKELRSLSWIATTMSPMLINRSANSIFVPPGGVNQRSSKTSSLKK